jgi:hypothetical protein
MPVSVILNVYVEVIGIRVIRHRYKFEAISAPITFQLFVLCHVFLKCELPSRSLFANSCEIDIESDAFLN